MSWLRWRLDLGFRMNTRLLFRIIVRSELCIAFVKQFGAGTFFQAKGLQRPRAVINFNVASGDPQSGSRNDRWDRWCLILGTTLGCESKVTRKTEGWSQRKQNGMYHSAMLTTRRHRFLRRFFGHADQAGQGVNPSIFYELQIMGDSKSVFHLELRIN
eukprot:s4863_g2.t1